MATHSKPIDNIIKEIKSVREEKTSLARKESLLFWKEGGLWYKAKDTFFKQDKTESWASFLRKLKIPLVTIESKVNLYKKWIKELGYKPEDLAGIHTHKLYRAMPYVGTKKTASKVLVKARKLSYKDFITWLNINLRK